MQAATIEKKQLGILEREIMSAVLYFDIFDYPLASSEIASFIRVPTDPTELENALHSLIHHGLLGELENFYFSASASSANVVRRKRGNRLAAEVAPRAMKSAKRISKFPFVEGVCISGSLSKNYFDHGSDVDFFIVTKPGRLWIARTFLVFFKKVFLLKSIGVMLANVLAAPHAQVKIRFT